MGFKGASASAGNRVSRTEVTHFQSVRPTCVNGFDSRRLRRDLPTSERLPEARKFFASANCDLIVFY